MEESQAALAKQHEQVLEEVARLQTDNSRLTLVRNPVEVAMFV